MKKSIISVILTALVIALLSTAALAAQAPVSLTLNGKNLPSDVPPVISSGQPLVPVRVISESLGADVSWNPSFQKVTITKNDSVIVLNINQKAVFKNGAKFQDLDVPAQIVNGRTMVPVRFVSEALGANVTWDQSTQTVVMVFEEKRDGMTPEELLVKSSEAMQQYKTYKFGGIVDTTVTISKLGRPQQSTMWLAGSYKVSDGKQEQYIKETVDIPGEKGQPATQLTIEIYSDGTKIYQNMNGAGWKEMPLGQELTDLMQNQDPQKTVQMMKDFGLILTYGNDVTIYGKPHYTLQVRIDGEKYKEFMKKILTETLKATRPADTPPGTDIDKIVDDIMTGMTIDMTERICVDKDTFLVSSADASGRITVTADGVPVITDTVVRMTIGNYGEDVTMPDVTATEVTK